MNPPNPSVLLHHRGKRIRKAYWTALVIAMRYWRLSLVAKIRGRKWHEQQIQELHARNAELVKNTILELQGLFLKMGQLLSIMSNFLPETFQKPLEALQDRLPEQHFDRVRQRIVDELGQPPETLFRQFDPVPLATASIGQTHRATLHSGEQVVVKVQHYGIEEIAQIDLNIIQRLTRVVTWFMDIKGMDYLYGQIRQMIEEELDFSNEARATLCIARQLKDEPDVIVPYVYEAYSAQRVLTLGFCEGVKITDLAQLDAWGVDRRMLAALLLRVWCRMVFKDGYYHADPHPGNLLVNAKGQLVILDYGATARLSPQLREGITQLIEATVKNDTEGMIEACSTMGFLADGPEAERMAKKMIGALRRFLQNEIKIEGLNFKDIQFNPLNNSLTELVQEIGFKGIAGTVQVPKDYVLLNRTVILLLGISNVLDARYNPLETVRPFAQQYLLQDKGGPLGYVRELLQRTVTNALALPDEVQKTMRKARAGELEMKNPDVADGAKRIARALRQLTFALLAIAGTFVAFRLNDMGLVEMAQWTGGAATLLFLAALWPNKA